MDTQMFRELLELAQKAKRPDIVSALFQVEDLLVDPDWSPTSKDKYEFKKDEKLDDDYGGDATDEEFEVYQDEDGFLSLK